MDEQTTLSQNDISENKNPKKGLLIGFLLVVLMILCCCGSYIGYSILFQTDTFDPEIAAEKARVIQNTNLIPLCQNYQDLSDSNMGMYFHPEYIDVVSLSQTKMFMDELIKPGFDCNTLSSDNPNTIVYYVEVNKLLDVGGEEAIISMEYEEDKDFTFVLRDQGFGWKIYEISVSEYF